MRNIGTLESESLTNRFRDVLVANGIENQAEIEDLGHYSVWVLDEDQVAAAAKLFARFSADPDSPEFQKAQSVARDQRIRWAKEQDTRRATVSDSARIGYERHFSSFAYVSALLLVISVAVAILSNLGGNLKPISPLFISDSYFNRATHVSYDFEILSANNGQITPEVAATAKGFLPEVTQGQIWRLVTPIFLHFSILHILFNVMMLRDLGQFLENRFGGWYFLLLVLAIAIPSNAAQAFWNESPKFGGLSGVNYGLFGFLWIRGKFDQSAGWSLNKNTVSMMLIWFVACLVGAIPNVANTVHGVGLAVGMAWGFLSSKR